MVEFKINFRDGDLSLVSWCEGDWTLSEPLEHIPSSVFTSQLVGGEELSPVLLDHQLLHLRPGHVDPVVEVSAPEHVVVRQNVSTLE